MIETQISIRDYITSLHLSDEVSQDVAIAAIDFEYNLRKFKLKAPKEIYIVTNPTDRRISMLQFMWGNLQTTATQKFYVSVGYNLEIGKRYVMLDGVYYPICVLYNVNSNTPYRELVNFIS